MMFLAVRKLLSAVRLGGLPLLCLGASLLPMRADADSQWHAGPVSAKQSKAADRVAETPLLLRIASLDRISGEDPQLPLVLLQRYHGKKLLATYQICVRADGVVQYVHPQHGVAEVDPVVISTLRTWRYAPQPPNTLTCMHEEFEFTQ